MASQKRGFTLIELLVVLAVIGVLFSILLPSIRKGVEFAQRTEAASNMRQIVMAWTQYAHDNEGKLCSSENTSRNEMAAWVKVPSGTTREAREDAIRGGALWTYLTNYDVFTDPNQSFPTYLNSYAMNGFLNGTWASGSNLLPAGSGVQHYSRVGGGTLVLIPEHDARGFNKGSFIMDPIACDWIDRVAGNYSNGDNLAFADGHVDYHRWEDPDTLRNHDQHYFIDLGSADCAYMETVFFPR